MESTTLPGHRAGIDDEELRRRLRSDLAWQGFSGSGRTWTCPCCLRTVEVGPHDDALAMLTAIRDHLHASCPPARTRPVTLQPPHLLRAAIERADTAFHLAHDPAWQGRVGDGRWVCPGCLEIQRFQAEGDEVLALVLAHRHACRALAASARTAAEVEAVVVGAAKQEQNSSTDTWMGLRPSDVATGAESASSEASELEAVREFQVNLMRHAPEVPGFRIATSYEACTNLSGDFNQFVTLADGRLAVAQGDVSGHGTRAGLLMAIANKLVELYARQYDDPRQVAIQLQRAMADDLGGRSFLTMSYGVLDPRTRTLSWIRAGHGPALIWRNSTGAIETLLPPGMAVGIPMHEAFARSLALAETRFEPGDVFVFATDGFTEAMDQDDEEFGMERMARQLQAAGPKGPDAVISAIRTAVAAHRKGVPVADDQSLLVIAADQL